MKVKKIHQSLPCAHTLKDAHTRAHTLEVAHARTRRVIKAGFGLIPVGLKTNFRRFEAINRNDPCDLV